jgi:hypothetical protein
VNILPILSIPVEKSVAVQTVGDPQLQSYTLQDRARAERPLATAAPARIL